MGSSRSRRFSSCRRSTTAAVYILVMLAIKYGVSECYGGAGLGTGDPLLRQ